MSASLPARALMHHPHGLLLSRHLPAIMASSYMKSRFFLHSRNSSRLLLIPLSLKPISFSILLSSDDRSGEEPYLRTVSLKKASEGCLASCLIGKNIIRVIFLPSLRGRYVKVTGDLSSSSRFADSTTLRMKSLFSLYFPSIKSSFLKKSIE